MTHSSTAFRVTVHTQRHFFKNICAVGPLVRHKSFWFFFLTKLLTVFQFEHEKHNIWNMQRWQSWTHACPSPTSSSTHITFHFLACNALFSDFLIILNEPLLHSQKKTNSIHMLNIDLHRFAFTPSGLAVLAQLLKQFKMEWKDLRMETNSSLETQKAFTSRQDCIFAFYYK